MDFAPELSVGNKRSADDQTRTVPRTRGPRSGSAAAEEEVLDDLPTRVFGVSLQRAVRALCVVVASASVPSVEYCS